MDAESKWRCALLPVLYTFHFLFKINLMRCCIRMRTPFLLSPHLTHSNEWAMKFTATDRKYRKQKNVPARDLEQPTGPFRCFAPG